MAAFNSELHGKMEEIDNEGIAPIQNLGHMSEAQVPRIVDRLYPAEFEHSRDAEKEGKMQLKYSLPDKMGQKFLTDEDVNYFYNKGKEQEMYQFDAWYATLFDHSDPAQLQMSRSINPAWFQRRMSGIEKTLDMQRRIAKLNLFGIQDKEDVMFAYAMASGRLNPVQFNRSYILPTQDSSEMVVSAYKKGIFAPRTYEDYIAPAAQNVTPTQPTLFSGVADSDLRLARGDIVNYVAGTAQQQGAAPWVYAKPNLGAIDQQLQSTRFRGSGAGKQQPVLTTADPFGLKTRNADNPYSRNLPTTGKPTETPDLMQWEF